MRTQEQIERLDRINREWRTIEATNPELIDSILDAGIKQELPIYIYEKQFVIVIYDNDNAEDAYMYSISNKHIIPLSYINSIDIDDICETYDDSYSCYAGIEEITHGQCINVENEQRLTEQFIRLSYYHADITNRQLIIETGHHHEWTSARTLLLEECIDTINNTYASISEESEDEKEYIEKLQNLIDERNKLIANYNHIRDLYYHEECEEDVPTYNEYIEQSKYNINAPDNFCNLFLIPQ